MNVESVFSTVNPTLSVETLLATITALAAWATDWTTVDNTVCVTMTSSTTICFKYQTSTNQLCRSTGVSLVHAVYAAQLSL